MDELLSSLNHAQRLAVISPASALQVLAPPGSGKTKTLTARVSYLIKARGVQPWNIIVCTFTVKAAREMKERIRDLVGDGLEKKLILGTFHSVARRFLVSYGHNIGIEKNFGIADMSDSKSIITRIIKKHDLSIQPGQAGAKISSLKAKSISSDQYAATTKTVEQEFAIVYAEYEDALKTSNLLDYDDLLLRCADLLRGHPKCVSNVQAVLIDEFQDTNNVQFDLMCLFAQHKKTVTIVGDPDQSIYGWRNAEIKNLQRMEHQFLGTQVINLEENYRSAGAILRSAQQVIEQDESRPAKTLKPTFGLGDRPVLRRLPTAEAEARWLVAEIRRTQALSAGLLTNNDFAILLRSAAVSRQIEAALGNAGIPYRMVGGTKFFDRVEVKLVLDYLRVINQPDHNDAIIRVINVPARGVGETTLKGLVDEADSKRQSLWNIVSGCAQGRIRPLKTVSSPAAKGLSEFTNIVLTGRKKLAGHEGTQATPFELVEWLLKKLDFEAYLKGKFPEDHDARWANVEELKVQTQDLTAAIAQGEDFVAEEILPEVEGFEQRAISVSEDALTLFLANIALSSEVQKKTKENAEQEQSHVTISTIHAAKGLEWPVVFVPACYEGSIPHSRAEDTDEERRLLYVAMTRAQALLYLSRPNRDSRGGETTMSSFLTHKGLDVYFEARGPRLYDEAVSELAKTLRRPQPQLGSLIDARVKLDMPEDDHWPLDGSFPEIETSKWDHGRGNHFSNNGVANRKRNLEGRSKSPSKVAGFLPASRVTIQNQDSCSTASTTLPPKIVSAADRMQELEAFQEEARLKAIEQRSVDKASSKGPSKKVKKAAIGSASITSYFGRPAEKANAPALSEPALLRTTSVPEPRVMAPTKTLQMHRHVSNPLHDISNVPLNHPEDVTARQKPTAPPLPLHKVRSIPHQPPSRALSSREVSGAQKDYPFLSSSPQRAESPPPTTVAEKEGEQRAPGETGFKPATTFHTTSMAQVAARPSPGRKTLGMGRKFVPWSARGGRG
ncbi:hypothetical protein MBLNU459_g4114t1 [Dothideomycetes sp. NU459]